MYAVVQVADFALQAALRSEPGAAGKPAVLFREQSKKSVVLLANPAAHAAGVERGMTAPQAVARCPSLLIRTPQPAAETEARAALLAVGFTLSPRIEDTAPGVCTIDLRGASPAQYERAAHLAVRQLQDLGLPATAGIADTPLLALYAARAAATAGKSQVRAITDRDAFLAPLPLAAADPSPDVAGIVASWGLRTFGDLTALSRDDVGRRLGPPGLELWDRARGGHVRPLVQVAPPQSFVAAMEFEDEIETLEPILFVLRRFLERLTLELRTCGQVAAALELALTLTDDTRHERSFQLPEPTADLEVLFRTLHTHLESLHTEAPIQALRLRAVPTRPLVRQQGLFDTELRDPHGFAETLARISALVGSDRVGTPRRQDSHRPDAVKLVPPPTVIPPPAGPAVHPRLGPPLRRFRPPLRAQLELTDGRPTYLWTERFHGAVNHLDGPWLSSGEWWQADRTWHRIEYDVGLAPGGIYRLILVDQNWLVEGEYD